jgi:hypothetical protein
VKKAQAGHAGPLIIVQWIEVEWGKEARGAEQATRRNALPTAYALPELETNSQILVLKLRWTDHDDFAHPDGRVKEYAELASVHLPGVQLEVVGQSLQVNPSGLWNHILRPPHSVPVGLVILEAGQWCRVRQSRRIVSEYTWTYLMMALNIGYGSELYSTSFLDQLPVLERADVPTLY